jgi:catechol 2,3-dioxygenase-like lactoylglutathione lyase family enzyme
MSAQPKHPLRLLGVELYFEDLARARDFYCGVLGLSADEEQPGHFVKLGPEGGFLCLEARGLENYPSRDKAVVFFELTNLRSFVAAVGADRFVKVELTASPPWAVLHDPEGHNVLLIESK